MLVQPLHRASASPAAEEEVELVEELEERWQVEEEEKGEEGGGKLFSSRNNNKKLQQKHHLQFKRFLIGSKPSGDVHPFTQRSKETSAVRIH